MLCSSSFTTLGSGLIDPDVADISKQAGIAIGVGALVGGWLIYDVALLSSLGRSQSAFAVFALAMTAAASWGLLHVFSGRAAYIHIGAIFGTIMTANVWFRILPAQRKMIAAAAAGTALDPSLGAQAKLRSKHNTFLAVPVVFLMLSNHYPVATYGNRYAWPVLIALIVLGWVAAENHPRGLVRRITVRFNYVPVKDQFKHLAEEVVARCRALASFSEDIGGTRRTFLSPPMRDVHRAFAKWLEPLGATVKVDAAGNLRALYPANEASSPRLLIGSHLDTVPNAGAYDGILGVVLTVALLEALAKRTLPYAIEVVGFSEEEGVRFGIPFIGSRALVGRLDDSLLATRDADGITVRAAIEQFGLNPGEIAAAALPDDVCGYLEFHIEQGPVLDQLNLPLAVVDSIAGQSRCEFTFLGRSNHAGNNAHEPSIRCHGRGSRMDYPRRAYCHRYSRVGGHRRVGANHARRNQRDRRRSASQP